LWKRFHSCKAIVGTKDSFFLPTHNLPQAVAARHVVGDQLHVRREIMEGGASVRSYDRRYVGGNRYHSKCCHCFCPSHQRLVFNCVLFNSHKWVFCALSAIGCQTFCHRPRGDSQFWKLPWLRLFGATVISEKMLV